MKRFIFSIAILGVLSVPAFAGAATLSFTIDQTSVPIGSPFEVAVILDTRNEINAIGTAVFIPSGLELVNTSNGNSIVNFWVEQPKFDIATRMLSFSGIIPNGISGNRRLLLVLTLKADVAGAYTLSFDSTRTMLYQNSPDGTLEPTTIMPLSLHAVVEAVNILAPVTDTEPPETFTPIVTRDPQLYDGAWMLIFATQDKGSGIAYYEVSESSVRTIDPSKLSWTKAESPHRLADQTKQYVYVRAVDEQGNTRTELYTSGRPFSWFDGLGLAILVVVLVIFIFWRWTKKHFYVSS